MCLLKNKKAYLNLLTPQGFYSKTWSDCESLWGSSVVWIQTRIDQTSPEGLENKGEQTMRNLTTNMNSKSSTTEINNDRHDQENLFHASLIFVFLTNTAIISKQT